MAWGDDDDDEEALPARTETAVNEKGFKTVVEWSSNAAEQKVKTTKEIFVKKVETRESRRPSKAESKAYAPTASASPARKRTIATSPSSPTTTSASPWKKKAEKMRHPTKRARQGEHERVRQEADVAQAPAEVWGGGRGRQHAASDDAAPAAVPGMRTSYVPPSMRGQAGAGVAGSALARMAAMPQYDDRDQSSLRVTNISEETTEADLQVLFAPYGRIARIYLAKDRETMVSRGFAFVSVLCIAKMRNGPWPRSRAMGTTISS